MQNRNADGYRLDFQQFFDKCRLISDDDMQSLWAKVLVGEANAPSPWVMSDLSTLASLDAQDADLFTSLWDLSWLIGEITPRNPPHVGEMPTLRTAKVIGFDTLTNLKSIGINKITDNRCHRLSLSLLRRSRRVTYWIHIR